LRKHDSHTLRIHWVPRQNKLEIPNDEEVNTREIHKCDGQTYDPDTMVAPLTPNTTPIFIFNIVINEVLFIVINR
jgi:hypothetical protein